MRRPEGIFRLHAFVGTVWLCLALLGVDARAATSLVQEARPMAASVAGPHSPSSARDEWPCTACDVIPVPSVQELSGEAKEPELPGWQMHAVALADSGAWFQQQDSLSLVPLRIAYCRWRN